MLAAAQILDAIATRLRNHAGAAWASTAVHTSRAWPLAQKDLPAWRVIAAEESIEPLSIHAPRLQQHTLQIELKGYAKAVDDLDDVLHQLASQSITALFNAPPSPDALSTLAGQIQLVQRGIDRAMQEEGEATLGLVQITLRAEFRTAANAPDTLI